MAALYFEQRTDEEWTAHQPDGTWIGFVSQEAADQWDAYIRDPAEEFPSFVLVDTCPDREAAQQKVAEAWPTEWRL